MFRNREDAGFQLAVRLQGRPLRDPLVLAIPRGGETGSRGRGCDFHRDHLANIMLTWRKASAGRAALQRRAGRPTGP